MTLENILEGLQIIAKYESGYCCAAEHDMFYAGGDKYEEYSEEDKKKLDELGWGYDEGLSSLYACV